MKKMMKSKGMKRGGKTKAKGMAKGGMMKKKGMARGGMKKGYAAGGMSVPQLRAAAKQRGMTLSPMKKMAKGGKVKK